MTTGLQDLDVKGSTAQAQRLWSLDVETCASVLEALLADRFLAYTSNGNYRRFDSV